MPSASSFKDILAVRFNPDGQWQRADVLILSDDAKGRGNGVCKGTPHLLYFFHVLIKKKGNQRKKLTHSFII